MYQIDFNKPERVHFIGIGGVSMSGLAVILKNNGFSVSGSDAKLSPMTDKLSAEGIKIYEGNLAKNLDSPVDVVIYTAAVHADNPEYKRAMELNIPMLTRAQLLGQIMKNYKTSIGVSGTHGKTTTSSMMTHILINADLNPTISVGGNLNKINGNIHVDSGDVFLTEACEYTNSFLSLHPTMEVILNVEADHLDFFKDINDIRQSFKKYIELLPENGTLIIGKDIKNIYELTKDAAVKNIVTFGEDADSDYSCTDLELDAFGCYSFKLRTNNSYNGLKISLNVPGMHNVLNALAAIAAACEMNICDKVIKDSMAEFTGTDRRFQKKGSVNDFVIVDDYAHHPQEIQATLNAAKNYPHNKLRVIFQPHTYSRTKSLFDDFAKTLKGADEVILAKIYPARETDTLGMSSKLLSDAINTLGTPSVSFETFEEIEKYVLETSQSGDLLITMGAGDVYKIGEDLLKK